MYDYLYKSYPKVYFSIIYEKLIVVIDSKVSEFIQGH